MEFIITSSQKNASRFVYIFQIATIICKTAQITVRFFVAYAKNNSAFRQYNFPELSEEAARLF